MTADMLTTNTNTRSPSLIWISHIKLTSKLMQRQSEERLPDYSGVTCAVGTVWCDVEPARWCISWSIRIRVDDYWPPAYNGGHLISVQPLAADRIRINSGGLLLGPKPSPRSHTSFSLKYSETTAGKPSQYIGSSTNAPTFVSSA